MPLPQGYLPRKNDVLLVRCTVRYDYRAEQGNDSVPVPDVHLSPVGSEWTHLILPLAEVHGIQCRSWKVGDMVKGSPLRQWGVVPPFGTVLATFEDKVWVHLENHGGKLITYEANDLEPYVAPEPEPQRMTEEDLMRGLEPLIPPPAPGSQAVVEDDDDIKF